MLMSERKFYNIEAEFGPWRPVGQGELFDPTNADTNAYGQTIIPTRIYGKSYEPQNILPTDGTKLYTEGD